jgi:hypothetical protein
VLAAARGVGLPTMRDADDGGGQQAEVYTYESSSLVYGMNWSVSTALALALLRSCPCTAAAPQSPS